MMMPDSGIRHRPCRSGRVLGLLVLSAAAAAARAQPVQGDVRSVGFEAGTGAGLYVIRLGQWFPILVELSGQGSGNYEVELDCEREDLDGDRVSYVEPYVAVTAEAGLRRVWCYAVTLGQDLRRPLKLDVIDKTDGALITSLSAPAAEAISNDTQLILDISDRRFTELRAIDTGAESYAGANWGTRQYYRSICVASLPARNLPDRWWGLEAVDVIVWDEPDPDGLSIAQLAALVQWVHNGGQLVLGIGPTWAQTQKSLLAEVMPLEGTRSVVEARRLPRFASRFAGDADREFKDPISIAVGEPAADALVTFRDRLPNGRRLNLIALRQVGSGRVIATAARLRDLADLAPTRLLLSELIDLNPNELEFNNAEAEKGWGISPRVLYEPVIAVIEFQRQASALVLAAFAFVAAYILLSTFGSWAWLKRHTLTHLSWTAFAAFAVVASVLSLGAVGLLRGVTGTVHNYSFVDLEAGSSAARVTAYFGYKSNLRQRVDLSLPGEGNYLRPLATGRDLSSADYATPERYAAITGQATLSETLMRATLKQFEGFWQGELQGSIRGSLIADRASGQITLNSWLQNDLDVEFTGGYLLYIDPRLREDARLDAGVPYRAAGLTHSFREKYYDSKTVPPAVNVLALELPAMKPGEKVDRIGQTEYEQYDLEHRRWLARGDQDPKNEPMLRTLQYRQSEQWASSFKPTAFRAAVEKRDAAALLASTRNLYLHNDDVTDFHSVGAPVSTVGLIDQDVSHWLARGQAVLLLLADRPGPATLHVNGKPKPSKAGNSLCRVRIPIRYVGRPPTGVSP